MVHAVRIHEYGGPDVLRWEEIDVDAPAPGEVMIEHSAVGLNYIDVYVRTGAYPQPALPFVPGMEGAGTVCAVGDGVSELKIGDRIAYAGPIGAYSQARTIAADRLVKIPHNIADETAAAMMLQGMTARYLLRKTYRVGPDTTLLFHAAAGGVGLIACQWAKALGATVIGTVGSEAKAILAHANGCTHTINYQEEDFKVRVKDLTNGAGVDVVYDSVGKDTFPGSLDCLKPMGMWVSFGQSSGALAPFDLALLAQKGSLFATRPSIFIYTAKRDDLIETANDLFDIVGSGKVNIAINQRYSLHEAAQAHSDLEARQTSGSSIFTI